MTNVAYTMKMPSNYVEMNASEMEYDGGWSWNKAFFTAATVGEVIAGVGAIVLTGGAGAFIAAGGITSTCAAASTAMGVGAAILGGGSILAMGSAGGFLFTSK